ncbi:rab11 family-interacting protein 4B isoform X2 [Folsomia candida]|uniref:FIP-RBD domain-containing protein n=1 Tax=Folsomia candida TaxID=158441 RepID=A0A226E0J0_FOLCA|nr:rab11 family-interacting protein 4B isoform X2 [Folsomia candida]OXA51242.1 hypothetical protein Fcan01_14615 [Folsomia candida]
MSSTITPISISKECLSSSPKLDESISISTPPPPIAFNGDTFTRPNRKIRKGLITEFMLDNGNNDGLETNTKKAEVTPVLFETPSAPPRRSSPTTSGGGSSSSNSIPSLVLRLPSTESSSESRNGSGSSSGSGRSGNGSNNIMIPSEKEVSLISGGGRGPDNLSISTNSEDNFELFIGEGESLERCSFLESEEHKQHQGAESPSRDLASSSECQDPSSRRTSSLTRNGWQRTSLRKTPTSGGGGGGVVSGDGITMTSTPTHRRWGSFRNSSGVKRAMVGGTSGVPSTNALANQLYRSSSYHSSGRSSAGDGEEMYSDSSLEGEVIDLTKKVHHLEEKFTVLAENQHDVDDRYTRSKQENAELKTKLFMLEETLRDVEMRSEEKLKEEARRHKEATARLEMEKTLQLENLEIKLQMVEKEISSSKIETKRLEGSLERERNENNYLNDKLSGMEREVGCLREENRSLVAQNRVDRENMVQESVGSQQALIELKAQLESLSNFHMNGGSSSSSNHSHSLRRNDSSDPVELRSRLHEAEDEIKRLKALNNQLEENNAELNAQMLNQRLEDGRNLLNNMNCVVSSSGGNSLAAEFEAMSNEEMRTALKDQKEANLALRAYIDNILLNIVEHYPQLLEVKHNNNGFNNACHNNKGKEGKGGSNEKVIH